MPTFVCPCCSEELVTINRSVIRYISESGLARYDLNSEFADLIDEDFGDQEVDDYDYEDFECPSCGHGFGTTDWDELRRELMTPEAQAEFEAKKIKASVRRGPLVEVF